MAKTASTNNEVTKKLKAAIKAKLEELGVYVDDELPEYIMVMIANKKEKAQMKDDLNLFLGKSTVKFVDWLFDLFDRLQSATSGGSSNAHASSHLAETSTREKEKEAARREEEKKAKDKERREKEKERERERERKEKEKKEREKEEKRRREKEEREKREKEKLKEERERQKREEERVRREREEKKKTRERITYQENRSRSRSRSKTWSDDEVEIKAREKSIRLQSKVVMVNKQREEESPEPTHKVHSQVIVKRHARPMADEKTMKDRSKNMFMKALTAASESSSSVQVQMEDEEQIEKRMSIQSRLSKKREERLKREVDNLDENDEEEEEEEEVMQEDGKEGNSSSRQKDRNLTRRLTIHPEDKNKENEQSDNEIGEDSDAVEVIAGAAARGGPRIVVTLKGAQEQLRKALEGAKMTRIVVDSNKNNNEKGKPSRKRTVAEIEAPQRTSVVAPGGKKQKIENTVKAAGKVEEYEPRPVSTKTSGEPSTNSPTFEKWNGQIDLNEEEDSTDDEAEIDAVLASTRQYSSSGSIDDDHLPPTLHLSQGNVYPDYTPTPINDKPVFSGTALINPHFRNIATLASGIGVAMTQPPPQLVAPQPTYIPQMESTAPPERCRFWPNCTFGVRCLYKHPMCKFDGVCTKPNCPFTHSTAPMPDRTTSASVVQQTNSIQSKPPLRVTNAIPRSTPSFAAGSIKTTLLADIKAKFSELPSSRVKVEANKGTDNAENVEKKTTAKEAKAESNVKKEEEQSEAATTAEDKKIAPDVPLAPEPKSSTVAATANQSSNGVQCKFGASCRNPNCHYQHPKACHFGSKCLNPSCHFYHPPKKPVAFSSTAKYHWKAHV